MKRIAILFAVAALAGCGINTTRDAAWHAWRSFDRGCDDGSYFIELRDYNSGDRGIYVRCTPTNRSKQQ